MATCAHCATRMPDLTALAPEARAERERVRPFCSSRCQLADLSRWLGGEHRIAGEPAIIEDNDETS
jgi:endogenous inhibitor of DNA gyrase (YacG/DUF329 family)